MPNGWHPLRVAVAWFVLILLALAGALFSIRYFPAAFPLLDVELEMDCAGAMASARELAQRYGWGPTGFRQAATFGGDEPSVRTYVTLEAGEADSLQRLLEAFSRHYDEMRAANLRRLRVPGRFHRVLNAREAGDARQGPRT